MALPHRAYREAKEHTTRHADFVEPFPSQYYTKSPDLRLPLSPRASSTRPVSLSICRRVVGISKSDEACHDGCGDGVAILYQFDDIIWVEGIDSGLCEGEKNPTLLEGLFADTFNQ